MGLGWIFVLAVILGSLLPDVGPVVSSLNDKFVHFSSYFLLMVWFSGMFGRRRDYLLIALVLVGLGILLDAIQGFIPMRYFDKFDIAANVGGTATGFGLALLLVGGWCRHVERLLTSTD